MFHHKQLVTSYSVQQAYISPGVGDHSGDNEEPESSHEGTPGVEQRLEEGVERRLEEGVERRLEEGLEQGLEERLEQGLEERLEQGLEEGLEQGLEEGLEQGLEEGLEQGLEEGLESPLGASPSLQQVCTQHSCSRTDTFLLKNGYDIVLEQLY